VIAALERGECDGILPTARGSVDGLAQFLFEAGVLVVLEQFPDPRQRLSIPMFCFCTTLIYRLLFHLKRMAPITVEAIPECFAKSQAEDFLTNQRPVLERLADYCPGEFLQGLWVMDSVHIPVPHGAHTAAFSFKACILGVWQDLVVWPIVCAFVPESENETVVGKRVFAAVEEVLGNGFWQ